MRISDCSSDVCSSDLAIAVVDIDPARGGIGREQPAAAFTAVVQREAADFLLDVPQARGVDQGGGHVGLGIRVEAPDADGFLGRVNLPAPVGDALLERGGHADAPHLAGIELAVGGGIEDMLVDLRSEEHTSELQSLMRISYAV